MFRTDGAPRTNQRGLRQSVTALSLAPALAWGQVAAPAAPASAPAVESLPQFLDSLSDSALTADRSQIYRIDGTRRIVRLGNGWSAALDEQTRGRLGSVSASPAAAGPPGRMIELVRTTQSSRLQLFSQRDGASKESGIALAYQLVPRWGLQAQSLRLRDSETGIARRQAEGGLRWGDASLGVDALLRRSGIDDPRANSPLAGPSPRADFLVLKSQWRPAGVPGLSLQAQVQETLARQTAPGDERLAGGSTEFGVGYTFAGDGLLRGANVYWREAVRLSLLSSGGLEERNTYRRTLGIDVPDGTPAGLVYAQLRQQTLLDPRDALAVLGWRHTVEPARGWRVQTLLEQAQPVGGPNAVRSTTLGLRVSQSAYPHHTALAETEIVRSSEKNSAYLGLKYTQRLTQNTVGALRLSVTDQRPQDPALVGVSNGKLALGWGWREGEHRNFNTLWRYTLVGRVAHADNVVDPGLADRRAHIVFGHAGGQVSERNYLSLRATRRWDRDESFDNAAVRTTNLLVLRGIHELDPRWSVSVHLGSLRDSATDRRSGFGAELGYKISRKVVIAVGYNPRSINDNELAIDDRLGKGVTLRLRFSFENALGRWLDPPWPLQP